MKKINMWVYQPQQRGEQHTFAAFEELQSHKNGKQIQVMIDDDWQPIKNHYDCLVYENKKERAELWSRGEYVPTLNVKTGERGHNVNLEGFRTEWRNGGGYSSPIYMALKVCEE